MRLVTSTFVDVEVCVVDVVVVDSIAVLAILDDSVAGVLIVIKVVVLVYNGGCSW